MIKISLIIVGKQKRSPHQEICEEYLKRLKSDVVIKILELAETPFRSTAEKDKVLKTETEKIKKAIPTDSFLIVLDAAGKTFTSEKFAEHFDRLSESGARPITIIIGGPLGLSNRPVVI
ncbi:MAG: 23S rRNA (pseudouridine(1915)-N(3))-methyltransferase RlmH [Candidatus Uhrbacteria bacterium]